MPFVHTVSEDRLLDLCLYFAIINRSAHVAPAERIMKDYLVASQYNSCCLCLRRGRLTLLTAV